MRVFAYGRLLLSLFLPLGSDPDGTRTEPIHGRGAIEEPTLSLAIPRLLHSVIAKQEDVLALPILPPSCKFRSIELPRL